MRRPISPKGFLSIRVCEKLKNGDLFAAELVKLTGESPRKINQCLHNLKKQGALIPIYISGADFPTWHFVAMPNEAKRPSREVKHSEAPKPTGPVVRPYVPSEPFKPLWRTDFYAAMSLALTIKR